MEYVDGPNLSEMLCRRNRGFSLPEVLPWIQQICEALDYAHSQGILHRDVKPANILRGPDGHVRLADFGIARTAREARERLTGHATSGTVLFMSPEQLMGDPLDARSDLYSLASSVYELLSGRPPFHTGAVVTQIQQKAPPRIPELPGDAFEVLRRALAKRPADRQRSCGEFYRQLHEAAAKASDLVADGAGSFVRVDPDAATVQIRIPRRLDATVRLGTLLQQAGLISEAVLQAALERQELTNEKLGSVLIGMGSVSEADIAQAMAGQLQVPFVRLEEEPIDVSVANLIPRDLALDKRCVPLRRRGESVVVAVADPLSLMGADELGEMCGAPVEVRIATETDIIKAIARVYAG